MMGLCPGSIIRARLPVDFKTALTKTLASGTTLIIRGAGQVGKTWSVLDFGRSHFEGSLHVIDLEQHPDRHRVFGGNLSAKRILSELEILINARIVPGKDLLFLDEIQSCMPVSRGL